MELNHHYLRILSVDMAKSRKDLAETIHGDVSEKFIIQSLDRYARKVTCFHMSFFAPYDDTTGDQVRTDWTRILNTEGDKRLKAYADSFTPGGRGWSEEVYKTIEDTIDKVPRASDLPRMNSTYPSFESLKYAPRSSVSRYIGNLLFESAIFEVDALIDRFTSEHTKSQR